MTAALPPDPRAHHLLKFLYQELKIEGKSLRWVCERSGVSYNTTKEALRFKSNISLASIEALLNAIGYTTKPTPLIGLKPNADRADTRQAKDDSFSRRRSISSNLSSR